MTKKLLGDSKEDLRLMIKEYKELENIGRILARVVRTSPSVRAVLKVEINLFAQYAKKTKRKTTK